MGNASEVEFKGEVDPVTEVDRRVEAEIRRMLISHRPSDGIVGEEEGGHLPERGRVWIIDPLDGTVNFIHGLAPVSVSVALWEDGAPMVGVVIEAIHGEEFTAVRGEGARLGNRPISVSSHALLSQALMATGFPYDRRARAYEYAGFGGGGAGRMPGSETKGFGGVGPLLCGRRSIRRLLGTRLGGLGHGGRDPDSGRGGW